METHAVTVEGEEARAVVPRQRLAVAGWRPTGGEEVAPRVRGRAAFTEQVGFVFVRRPALWLRAGPRARAGSALPVAHQTM